MKHICLDEKWTFRRGFADSLGALSAVEGIVVNLPHDSMISTKTSPDAPATVDSGYFDGDICNYTKYVMIPKEWMGQKISLNFDGVMMHTTVDINGCRVGEHHYGYTPFRVDITDYVTYGEENRITINTNAGLQSSSRWYSGCGLFRGVELCVSDRIHIANDGIYVYTKEVSDDIAFLESEIEISNETLDNHLVEVQVSLVDECSSKICTSSNRVVQINSNKTETAYMPLNLVSPKLWSIDEPNLYLVQVKVIDKGIYRTHLCKNEINVCDEESALFGVRTITADVIRGLRINGKTEKLKGGCLHHDNGLLGAVSLYESEARKVKKLKSIGFNAIRTAHNPPSKALVEACDRLGMYIFDEAFDAWGTGKRVGDYSTYFNYTWEEELTAFIKRDRIHPSVIIWSTGNEIPERGGLNNGYTLATKLAKKIKSLDLSRPVSNGICSFWSGLDDCMAEGVNQSQNAKDESGETTWERMTEPFTNGLDIVGYNYMEELYERDHEMFPERVILGSENFPKEIGYRWPMVEALPYVIGDFTWTAWDYLGEAGIGKALYVDEDDVMASKMPWEIMPDKTSPYPWRTGNDADIDINGNVLAQGAYRSVVWGSSATHIYTYHPDFYGKVEKMSMWAFPAVTKNWNYNEYEGKPIDVLVFSNADEVALSVNDKIVEKKMVDKSELLPNSVKFSTKYEKGKVEAISFRDGVEVSRDVIESCDSPCKVRLTPEKKELRADGHDVSYIGVEILDSSDRLIPDAEIQINVSLEGCDNNCCEVVAVGSGNPKTDEVYTKPYTKTFRGRAMVIVRSGYEAGNATIKVSSDNLQEVESMLIVK